MWQVIGDNCYAWFHDIGLALFLRDKSWLIWYQLIQEAGTQDDSVSTARASWHSSSTASGRSSLTSVQSNRCPYSLSSLALASTSSWHSHSCRSRNNAHLDNYTNFSSLSEFGLMTSISPHRGLPPCRGGGAYAPMTRTIFNLKERS